MLTSEGKSKMKSLWNMLLFNIRHHRKSRELNSTHSRDSRQTFQSANMVHILLEFDEPVFCSRSRSPCFDLSESVSAKMTVVIWNVCELNPWKWVAQWHQCVSSSVFDLINTLWKLKWPKQKWLKDVSSLYLFFFFLRKWKQAYWLTDDILEQLNIIIV